MLHRDNAENNLINQKINRKLSSKVPTWVQQHNSLETPQGDAIQITSKHILLVLLPIFIYI